MHYNLYIVDVINNKIYNLNKCRTAFESVLPEKVLLSLNDIKCAKSPEKAESETYQCNPDHVYVIVGKYFHSFILWIMFFM